MHLLQTDIREAEADRRKFEAVGQRLRQAEHAARAMENAIERIDDTMKGTEEET